MLAFFSKRPVGITKVLGNGILLFIATLSLIGCSTQLQSYSERGDIQSVLKLLEQGESIYETDPIGSTALHYAARSGQVLIAKILLSKGAQIDAKNDYEETPLNQAVYFCHEKVVAFLIDKGANVHNRFKTNNGLWLAPIFNASGNNCDHVILKGLLNAGANPNETEPGYGYSPLMFSAGTKNLTVSEMLLAAGADVNQQAKDGTTALIVAAKTGNKEATRLFLEAGANPTIKAIGENEILHKDLQPLDTALLVAKRYGHNDIVSLLEDAEKNWR